MKVLHLLGHNAKWNLDLYYQNQVGDGFIFCAYSFENGFLNKTKLSGYKTDDIKEHAWLDLQYFGKKESGNVKRGNLATYSFHPCNIKDETETSIYLYTSIIQGIRYQLELGLKNIIIPNYVETQGISQLVGILKQVNLWLRDNKLEGVNYYMTLPIGNRVLYDSEKISQLLYHLTDKNIVFDGYYVVCESKPETKQKVNIEFSYLNNLQKFFSILKKQKFKTIYAYANWDALIFLALTDIDYITVASYENLRNFNVRRFLIQEDGGPSKGWYFSEKLLNFIKAQYIDLLREKNCIDVIRNDYNIFSDYILKSEFLWNNHKPEVHKNYIISIVRQLNELADIEDLDARKQAMLFKIETAITIYTFLMSRGVYLLDESQNYHLSAWKSFLLAK